MKEYPIKALARILKADPVEAGGCFTGISIDSRTLKAGDCFFAVKGENFDGHDYVSQAFNKGAACAVVSKDIDRPCVVKVNDTIKALGDFARQYRRDNNFRVIAITGSTGKTTTRQIACRVLSRKFRVHTAPENFNNEIGLPLTLLGAEPTDQVVLAELGSNRPGDISYLTRIAQPDIAVITNVQPAHLEGLANLETIALEKLSIHEALQLDGELIINGQCPLLVKACKDRNVAFKTFGKSNHFDTKAENIIYRAASSEFTIDQIPVVLPLPGKGNLENALAAWAVCSRLGITAKEFAEAVKDVPAVAMRAELLQIGSLTVLNDCYNANPASMKNALEILSNLGRTKNRRLVFICGDMAELGSYAEQMHRQLGADIGRAGVRLLLAAGKFAEIVTVSAKENTKYNLQTKCFEDAPAVCNYLKDFIKDYDIILVKGSRCMQLDRVVEELTELSCKGCFRGVLQNSLKRDTK